MTKNSGGPLDRRQAAAARDLGLPVVMVARPPLPDGAPGAATVADAVRWLSARRNGGA